MKTLRLKSFALWVLLAISAVGCASGGSKRSYCAIVDVVTAEGESSSESASETVQE